MLGPKVKLSEQKRSSSIPDWLGGSGFWDSPPGGGSGHDDDGDGDDDGSVVLNHVLGAFESVDELMPVHGQGSELGKERKVLDVEEEKHGFRRQSAKLTREAFPSVSASLAEEAKLSDLEFELSREVINMDVVRNIAKSGIPDGSKLRATMWKLVLGYLPVDRELWETELAENRLKYASLKSELLLRPAVWVDKKAGIRVNSGQQRLESSIDSDGPLRRHEIADGDHPLSNGKASAWHKYFQDTETAEQINHDILRTHPDMSFFSGDSPFSHDNQDAMRSILLLFAKMNPAIRYVQEMNEVLSPIYYVVRTDPDVQNALMELLKAHDEELWRHLVVINKDMLLRVCVAMLLCARRKLLRGDFISNMKLLLHYPQIDIDYLLKIADEIDTNI